MKWLQGRIVGVKQHLDWGSCIFFYFAGSLRDWTAGPVDGPPGGSIQDLAAQTGRAPQGGLQPGSVSHEDQEAFIWMEVQSDEGVIVWQNMCQYLQFSSSTFKLISD